MRKVVNIQNIIPAALVSATLFVGIFALKLIGERVTGVPQEGEGRLCSMAYNASEDGQSIVVLRIPDIEGDVLEFSFYVDASGVEHNYMLRFNGFDRENGEWIELPSLLTDGFQGYIEQVFGNSCGVRVNDETMRGHIEALLRHTGDGAYLPFGEMFHEMVEVSAQQIIGINSDGSMLALGSESRLV